MGVENRTRPDEVSDNLVGAHLREITPSLLTHPQEVYLSKEIQKGLVAERKLGEVNGRLSSNEHKRLKAIIEDGRTARNTLVAHNGRLVVSIAKKFRGRGVEFLDLIQEGNVGLIEAANRFDWRRGYKFSTLATYWIRQAVTKAVSDYGRTIRIPTHIEDLLTKMFRMDAEFRQNHGRAMTPEELGEEIELNPKEVKRILQSSQEIRSLEEPISEDTEFGELLHDTEALSPEDGAGRNLLRKRIDEALATLPAREARVLIERYGLRNGVGQTLENLGNRMGVTRERIRQIEASAFEKIEKSSKSRALRNRL